MNKFWPGVRDCVCFQDAVWAFVISWAVTGALALTIMLRVGGFAWTPVLALPTLVLCCAWWRL